MILKRSIIVFPIVLFLAVPCFAQNLPDGSGAFNAYQQKAQQNFEQKKNKINASDDGIDAKKQAMDNRFNDMKKQFEKNGEHMGDDNGFMAKKAKEKLDDGDFEKNTPETSLNNLKEKTATEDDVTSRRNRIKDANNANNDNDEDEEANPMDLSSDASSKLNHFAKKYGLLALLGGGSLLGIIMYLFLQKEIPEESEDEEKCG